MSNQATKIGPEALNVLVIEDDVLYATIIGEMLREGIRPSCEVVLKHSAAAGKATLAEEPFHIVLLNLYLPDGGGTELVAELQEINPHVPILVMTDVQNESVANASLQAGAQDYLVKGDFKVQSLERSIRYALERHRLRQELESSLRQRLATVERGFRRLIDQNADGILVVRPDGRISFTNHQAEQLFEQDAADLLGKLIPFPIPAEGASEIQLLRRDGQIVHAELRAVAIDWQDEPAYLLSLRDTTARKEQEAALQTYADSLVAQNEDLEAYARMVAHDLKAPLGVLVGYAETLREQNDDLTPVQLTHYFNLIARSGRKLERIINELLLLASVRQEKVDVRPLDMGEILAGVQERLDGQIKQKEAILEIPGSWPAALGYAPWIEEVWVNYLSNALKYGGDPPHVKIAARPDEQGMVRFTVTDNGPGLPPEDQAQLFTQFPQMSQVRVDGHGLGLSIVRRIVTRLGGQVGVESAAGRGSTFYFSLPTPHAAAADHSQDSQTEGAIPLTELTANS